MLYEICTCISRSHVATCWLSHIGNQLWFYSLNSFNFIKEEKARIKSQMVENRIRMNSSTKLENHRIQDEKQRKYGPLRFYENIATYKSTKMKLWKQKKGLIKYPITKYQFSFRLHRRNPKEGDECKLHGYFPYKRKMTVILKYITISVSKYTPLLPYANSMLIRDLRPGPKFNGNKRIVGSAGRPD